jgi:hypothetical protein
MLSLPAAFAANRRQLPPPPPLPLQLGRHRLHCHHRGQETCHRSLPKIEAKAAAPPAYQQQHQCENFTSPDDLDLFNLSTVFEVCDDGREKLAISKLLT